MSDVEFSGDEIVVSGISGRFPNSNNMAEFEYNLYNKIDMVDDDESRWKHFHPSVPKRMGKIRNLEKFDASFFSVLSMLANEMDPQLRVLLEHSYEAIVDAGISPQSLVGSRTGVFIANYSTDSLNCYTYQFPSKGINGLFGNSNFLIANRISYSLGLCGPSMMVDTACSSSAYALDIAYKYIMSGACDAAIVGGSQLVLKVQSTVEYTKCDILAEDGICRPFDEHASGFTRADTVAAVFLQRQKDSKRVYARLMHTNSNNDGNKESITFPSKELQQRLMEDFFAQSKIDPNCVTFVEAHATGTKLGDPQEVHAIDEVFCKNKNRPKPLMIGSVKSNMGHAEAASGIASIAKILLALERGKVAPNINLTSLREGIPAFDEKRMRVVTEVEDLEGPFISLNSFGMGGSNSHALFKANLKEKVNGGRPSDDLTRLVLWSGRTETAVNAIFDDITKRHLDVEHIALLQNSQKKTTKENNYRGYGIFLHNVERDQAVCSARNIKALASERRPMVWVFAGIGSQWPEMGRDLMKFPTIAKTISSCHEVLKPTGLNLMEILQSPDPKTFDKVLNSYVGIAAVEIALVDTLKSLGIEPDYLIGHSVGELTCAYADGCLTLEETMMSAYYRGKASEDSVQVVGAMAAIGLNHKDATKIIPKDIDIACHNSADSTTISGPAESVRSFVEKLEKQKIFAKEVACSGIPLHSRYIKRMGENLLKNLSSVIKTPKKRSSKWLSSSFPQEKWANVESQYSSAQYMTQNLLNPVYFEEVLSLLPKNSLTIEIAPHGLLKSLVKGSLKDGEYLSLTQRGVKDGCEFLLESLGKLFQNGVDMDIANLFPPVSFPVSRGTPMISPHIKWNHEENYAVPSFNSYLNYEHRNFTINMNDKAFKYIEGHEIDGKVLFPAAGWLTLVWETFSLMHAVPQSKMKVVFEDVKLLRATSMQKNLDIFVTISIHRVSGKFEIVEGKSAIVQGVIRVGDNEQMTETIPTANESAITLKGDDFYKELRLRGYFYKGLFRSISEIRSDGLEGKIKWQDEWTSYIDCLIQFKLLTMDTRMLVLPTFLQKIVIDPQLQSKVLSEIEQEEKLLSVQLSPYTNVIKSGGVEVHDFEGTIVNRRRAQLDPVLEVYKFISHFPTPVLSNVDMAKVCVQLVLEQEFKKKIVLVDVDSDDGKEPLNEFFSLGFGDLPVITSEIHHVPLKNFETFSKEKTSSDIVLKSSCIDDREFLEKAKILFQNKGFILSREKKLPLQIPEDLKLLAVIQTEVEFIFVMKFEEKKFDMPEKVIKITPNIKEWLEPLQNALKSSSVLVFSENEEISGILGLVNCITKEPNGEKLKCIIINDKNAPKFDVKSDFYLSQLRLGFPVNVLENGQWGTYRHLKISQDNIVKARSDHNLVDCLVKGDLSSIKWVKGSIDPATDPHAVKIQYAALNFRDIMIATGRIQLSFILGSEFAGVTSSGRRVAATGLSVVMPSLSTYVDDRYYLMFDVPDDWSLAEAATIPVVYCTVYLAFFVHSKIEKGKSILIHAGSGGVGLAAIHVALSYGLDVYTTVGTEEKRKYLVETFPALKPSQIGNSRDTSFERMIFLGTNGRGVDFVLNSLSDEKLQASLRCLARHGTFLEIGKYDIMNRSKFDMGMYNKRIVFRPVFFDDHTTMDDTLITLKRLIEQDIKAGIVKPLKQNIFDASEVEKAFRFMATGKHVGKVMLKIRENPTDEFSLPISVLPKLYCDPDLTYLIVGGLGGFGLELADWLVSRGCRKLVLSSSRGLTSTYQAFRIKHWQARDVSVSVDTSNASTLSGCSSLLKNATRLGPVGGIYNLAVALRDGIFENQNLKMFEESLAPKADATRHLDELSRKLCPDLKQFVVFSSVSCGRGNAGQSNYGFANAIMERICERRSKLGLPGKAIQWGAIGDVGLLADLHEKKMDMEIGGTLPQRIQNCFEVLDSLLSSDDPIVGSMVVAEKRKGDVQKGNVVEALLNILWVNDRKSIAMNAPLSKLGLDSLMAIEIQQVLERDYGIVFSLQELRSISLSHLEKMTQSKGSNVESISDKKVTADGFEILLTNFGDEKTVEQRILKLTSKKDSGNTKVLIIPGIEGMCGEIWHKIAANLNYPTYVLQSGRDTEAKNLKEILDAVSEDVLDLFSKGENFLIIGYSFGSLLALLIANLLEARGLKGSVKIIDGSPQFLNKLAVTSLPDDSEKAIQTAVLVACIQFLMPDEVEATFEKIFAYNEWKDQVEALMDIADSRHHYSMSFGKKMMQTLVNRIKICLELNNTTLDSVQTTPISLIKSKETMHDIAEDYGLGKYCCGEVNVTELDGNHSSILENEKLFEILNK